MVYVRVNKHLTSVPKTAEKIPTNKKVKPGNVARDGEQRTPDRRRERKVTMDIHQEGTNTGGDDGDSGDGSRNRS